MKNYIVYKLLDKEGKVLWIGTTSHSIKQRIRQHRLFLDDFDRCEIAGTYKTQKRALNHETRLLRKHVDENGVLPPYVQEAFS